MAYDLNTKIEVILENPKLSAIVEEFVPGASKNPGIAMVKKMPLKAAASFVPAQLTAEVLAKIEEKFAKVED